MKLGIIGAGNIANAIVFGLLKSKKFMPSDMYISNPHEEKLKIMKENGLNTTVSNTEVAKISDVIILAVKPHMHANVLDELKNIEGIKDKLVISPAPSITLDFMLSHLGKGARVLRAMPNTPAQIGKAVTCICGMCGEDEREAENVFSAIGDCVFIDESKMPAAVALCGSSPAMIYMLIEAMADAGVKMGFTRADAYRLSAKTVIGAAEMISQTKKHPGELKDAVCSPGGTTIDEVASLEKSGFRADIMEALDVCAKKAISMM